MAGFLLPLAGLLGGLLSSVATTVLSTKSSKDVMRYQQELNQQGIDTANRYNEPINQMSRLRAAGLNPNLVYGNGTVQGLTSSGNAGTTQGLKTMPFDVGVTDAVDKYLQSRQIDQSIDESKSRQLLLAQQVRESMSRENQNWLDSAFNRDTYYTRKHQLERQNTVIEKLLDKTSQEISESQSREDLNKVKLDEINANIKFLASRTGLTDEQARTEVKRRFVMDAQAALYRSNIRVNEKELDLIAAKILNVRQDTANKTLWHELQELEKNSRGALKQLLANHENWAIFYGILKDIFGSGVGLSYKF